MISENEFLSKGIHYAPKAKKLLDEFEEIIGEKLDKKIKVLLGKFHENAPFNQEIHPNQILNRTNPPKPFVRRQMVLGKKYSHQGLVLGVVWLKDNNGDQSPWAYCSLKFQGGGFKYGPECELESPTYDAKSVVENVDSEHAEKIKSNSLGFGNSGGIFSTPIENDLENALDRLIDFMDSLVNDSNNKDLFTKKGSTNGN